MKLFIWKKALLYFELKIIKPAFSSYVPSIRLQIRLSLLTEHMDGAFFLCQNSLAETGGWQIA
ncbi:hypothetical protein NNRS527_00899 [Nitrosospira sp. NRS527]|nr:hypothetical protein NNRS527_00899 [Nitrosospira sp. NRS527]